MSERTRKPTRAPTVRLTMTLEARLEDLTDDRVRQDLAQFSNVDELVDDPETWREVGWQRQLLEAIRAQPELLRQWLVDCLVETFGGTSLRDTVCEALGIGIGWANERDFLLPLVPELPNEPRRFFEQAQEQGVFAECTIHVWKRAVVRLVEARLSNGGTPPDDAPADPRC
jgi:hypothetical protein